MVYSCAPFVHYATYSVPSTNPICYKSYIILVTWCPTKSKLLSFAIGIPKDTYKHSIIDTEYITVITSKFENFLKQYCYCLM